MAAIHPCVGNLKHTSDRITDENKLFQASRSERLHPAGCVFALKLVRHVFARAGLSVAHSRVCFIVRPRLHGDT